MSESIRANGKLVPTERDGYRVELFSNNEEELGRLDLTCRRNGMETLRRTLYYEPNPDPGSSDREVIESTAALQRNLHLASAVCRFVNTGGSLEEAKEICETTIANLLNSSGGRLTMAIIPSPWILVSTEVEERCKHIFTDPNQGSTVVWLEDDILIPTHSSNLERHRSQNAQLNADIEEEI